MTENIIQDRFYKAVRTFTTVTYGACFNAGERSELMRLSARCCGLDSPLSLISSIEELESHDVKTERDCIAYLSATMFLPDFPEDYRLCAMSMRDYLRENRELPVCRDRNNWLSGLFSEKCNSVSAKLSKAAVLFLEKDYDPCFRILEGLISSGNDTEKTAERLLAVFALESGNAELAFSAIVRSEYIFRPDRKSWVRYENPELTDIRREALMQIGIEKATKITDETLNNSTPGRKIGFA